MGKSNTQHFTVQLSLSKWLPRRRSIVPPTRTSRSALKSVKANLSSALHVSLLPSTIPSSMSPISLAAKPSAVLLEASKLCTSRPEPLAVTARRLQAQVPSLLCAPWPFRNEDWQNRGRHSYTVRQHQTQGWSSWSSSVSVRVGKVARNYHILRKINGEHTAGPTESAKEH